MAHDQSSWTPQHNGEDAAYEDLIPLAFAGYAHFTAMQVRKGAIRGLDLHLERLQAASRTMFRQALSDEHVAFLLREALNAGPEDLSLMATVYSPAGEFTLTGTDAPLSMLIRTGPPNSGPEGPLKLAVFEHERFLPEIKHVGEVAKTLYLRQASAKGFDDGLFVDRQGRISEGTIWNIAFWDGKTVVWPEADMLTGITMKILRRQLARRGIRQRTQAITMADIQNFSGAAVMNSWTPGVPVEQIGGVKLGTASKFVTLLHQAYQAEHPVAP